MVNSLFAQSTFEFVSKKKTAKIPFKLVSNLIVIPVKVNGTELSFLLDTGVKETILFNVSKVDSIALNSAEVFSIKGANDVEVSALKSKNNIFEVENIKSSDQVVYVAFNQESNLSAYLGEEIHGILGYHFFKDFVVESDTGPLIFTGDRSKSGWDNFSSYNIVNRTISIEQAYFLKQDLFQFFKINPNFGKEFLENRNFAKKLSQIKEKANQLELHWKNEKE